MTHRILISIIALAVSLATHGATPSLLAKSAGAARDRWVDSVMATLSPRQRIAQLIVATINPSDGASSRSVINNLVGKEQVGGILFNRGSLAAHTEMTALAQSVAKVPLFVTLDGEWGPSMRISEATRFPYNMGLGAIDNERLLYDYGRETARECKLLGVNVNFAPVMDVNSNPSNPVIGYRSFGESPERVARLGVAYSKGLEDGGVIAVAKHFPGHGDTSADSHKELPLVSHDAKTLKTTDLIPFERFIGAGLSGVMVGHLNVPALDKSGMPASMSPKITSGLLKEKMGFKGLVFTDALGMKGADTSANPCVTALKAGADVLLAAHPGSDIKAIEQAIATGTLTQKTIDERCRKILEYKYALGLSTPQPLVSIDRTKNINSPESQAVAQRLAAASITLLRNNKSLLPLSDIGRRTVAVVNIGAKADNIFTTTCAKYCKIDRYATDTQPFSTTKLAEIRRHDYVIVAVYSDSQGARSVFSQFAKADNAVGVFLINPYQTAKFKASLAHIPAIVIAYDDTPHLQSAAAQAIFGGIDVTGRLPVNLPGLAPIGTGLRLNKLRLGYSTPSALGMAPWLADSIDALVNEGLRTHAFPGCQVLIAKDGVVVFDKAYGHLDYRGSQPVNDFTLYDLASVSKATGTLPGIMVAYDRGLFKLDDKASKHIPGLRDTPKADITVNQLLFHESGMPPSLNMFRAMMDTDTYTGQLITSKPTKTNTVKIAKGAYGNASARLRTDILSDKPSSSFPIEADKGIYVGQSTIDTIMQRIYDIPLRAKQDFCYSCLNFALLMDMEQRLTGKPHDQWVSESVFTPLAMNNTCYRPLLSHKAFEIAPTENDPYLRRQLVRGYVHDELANFSGGVQGNAGLFANANDLAKLCQMWLNGGKYGGQRVMSPSTVKLFTTAKSRISRRGLGFDKPDTKNPDKSPTTPIASGETYGHLGFTGTNFWVDPTRGLIVIFLCNRVNPSRDNAAFARLEIRPRIMELAIKSLFPNIY